MKNVSYENISKNQSYDLFLKQGIWILTVRYSANLKKITASPEETAFCIFGVLTCQGRVKEWEKYYRGNTLWKTYHG